MLSIAVGITIGLLASCVQSLGLTLQRKSHVLNQQLPEHKQRAEHRRPLWLLGLAVFLISNLLGSLVQIASLPVVILAPLGALSLLWNAFFARLLLGDLFSSRLAIGTLFITGGAVLIAVFGIVPDSERERDLDELMQLWGRKAFIAWFSIETFIVLVWLIFTHIIEYSINRRLSRIALPPSEPSSPLALPENPSTLTTGITDTLSSTLPAEQTPLLQLHSNTSDTESPTPSVVKHKPGSKATSVSSMRPISKASLLLALSYASLSGIISGVCLLLAKSGISLLVLSLPPKGTNQFTDAKAWLLLISLIVCALLQLWYMHKALVLADPTIVCPSAFCLYNVSSIINGLIYFDQFALIPPLHLGLVVLGIIILLAGVWAVSVIPSGSEDQIDEEWEGTAESTALEIDDTESSTVCTSPTRDTDYHLNVSTVEDVASDADELSSLPPAERMSRSESNVLSLGDTRHSRRSTSTSLFSRRQPFSHGPPAVSTLPLDRSMSSPQDSHPLSAHARRHSTSYVAGGSTISGGREGPLSPTLLAGLQIGLSPVSPGFAVAPRRRVTSGQRRSTLAAGESFDSEDANAGRDTQRRTLREEHALGAGMPNGLAVNNTLEEEREDSRNKWRWLKRLTGKGRQQIDRGV